MGQMGEEDTGAGGVVGIPGPHAWQRQVQCCYPSAGQEGMQGTNSGYMQPPIPHYQEGEPMEAEEDWEDGYVEAASLFRQPV